MYHLNSQQFFPDTYYVKDGNDDDNEDENEDKDGNNNNNNNNNEKKGRFVRKKRNYEEGFGNAI